MNFIRKYTEEERVRMVEEALQYGSNSLVAAKYNINPVLLCKWKSCYRKYGKTLIQKKSKELDNPIYDYKKQCTLLTKENSELKLELAVLKDMLKKKI